MPLDSKERVEIENQILEIDGSGRDVNFSSAKLASVGQLFKMLEARYQLKSSSDSEGKELMPVSKVYAATLTNGISATIHSTWESNLELIRILQVFTWREDNDQYFVELTFFPEDIAHDRFSLSAFLGFLKLFTDSLSATEYYVRYESVSWEFGDISKGSGLIFSHRDLSVS